MRKKPIKVGDIIHAVFWDHCENFSDAMQFEVYGKVTKITKKAYIIHTWMYHDPVQRAADSNFSANENYFAIVKSTIDTIKVLNKKRPFFDFFKRL